MKHTPGPWKASISSANNLWIYSDSKPICTVPVTRGIEETSEENAPQAITDAQLIAAAPELLQTLKCFYALVCQDKRSSLSQGVLNSVRNLIAKAEGQE